MTEEENRQDKLFSVNNVVLITNALIAGGYEITEVVDEACKIYFDICSKIAPRNVKTDNETEFITRVMNGEDNIIFET